MPKVSVQSLSSEQRQSGILEFQQAFVDREYMFDLSVGAVGRNREALSLIHKFEIVFLVHARSVRDGIDFFYSHFPTPFLFVDGAIVSARQE